jgi:FSR family fosmidomycin resistance protein-like MFS transporter
MFGHFTHHVSNALLAPLQPLIRDDFGLSYAQAGLLVSAFTVSQGLSQAPIGLLADRIGSRAVITCGLIITGALTFLIGLSGSYWHLLALLVALGLVAGTYHAPAASLVAQTFSRDRRGAALGMHIMGGNFSFFATPLLAAGLAAATLTWRSPYLAFAIAPLLAGLFLVYALPRLADRGGQLGQQAGILTDLGAVLRMIGPLLGLAILSQMLMAAIYAFLALYLVDARGFAVPMAAVIVATPFISGLVGAPVGGFLSDRFGRKPVIVTSLVCVGPLLLAFTRSPTELLIPILLLMGIISSARMPVIEGLLLDRAPETRRATTLGAYYLAAQELGGFAAPILGALAGSFGIDQAYGLVAIALTTLSGLVFLLQRRL